MKAATANLIALLANARVYHFEDVAAFQLPAGNFSISTDRSTANTTDPMFKRGGVRTQIGVEVSSMSVDLLCNANTLVLGLPAMSFAYNGGFDGANMMCTRYYRAAPGGPIQGNQVIFAGRVSDLDVDAAGIHMTVMSEMELLNMQLPRNMFQAGCLHDVYDADCGVVAASFTTTQSVGNGSTIYSIASNQAHANGYFGLGTLTFITGNLAGLSRSVKTSYANGAVVPVLPLPSAPANGDTFSIKPGCDKLFTTCNTTFTNTANFRGYEFIPTPETSY